MPLGKPDTPQERTRPDPRNPWSGLLRIMDLLGMGDLAQARELLEGLRSHLDLCPEVLQIWCDQLAEAEAATPRAAKPHFCVSQEPPCWIRAPYVLTPADRTAFHHLRLTPLTFGLPQGPPDPDLHLPDPWDSIYRKKFRQAMQPVKLWSNANYLAEEIEAAAAPGAPSEVKVRAKAAMALLAALIARMRDFTVPADPAHPDGAAFLESRFDFSQANLRIPGPWVSGIANAFAILACCRLVQVLPDAGLQADIRRYADAYLMLRHEAPPPEHVQPLRWISYLDADRHLWFEEYPMPDGRVNLVLNGHIFAVMALHQAAALWPGRGYEALVQGGIATVEARFHAFLRRGTSNLYSLCGPRKGDYLPLRTIRQQYELYLLTGAPAFVENAMLAMGDCAHMLDPIALRRTVEAGLRMMTRRRCFETYLSMGRDCTCQPCCTG